MELEFGAKKNSSFARNNCWLNMALLCLALLGSACGHDAAEEAKCDSKFADRKPTKDELDVAIRAHGEWVAKTSFVGRQLQSFGEDPRRLSLCHARLIDANLSNAVLASADLRGADLSGADLSGADLSFAHLSYAKLSRAKLSRAKLWNTHLSGADLSGADLNGAQLYDADLTLAEANDADLRGANLKSAHLRSAGLGGANLSGADLSDADLKSARLSGADLSNAVLYGAKLSDEAVLLHANLSGANMRRADLSGADLSGANLSGANLEGADLSSVKLVGAVLGKPGEPLNVQHWVRVQGLSAIIFRIEDNQKYVQLREELKRSGFRQEERDVTAALRRNAMNDLSLVEYFFQSILFDLTSEFGASPSRALGILLGGIFLFTPLYAFALRTDPKYLRRQRKGLIWRVWSPDRILDKGVVANPERLSFRGTTKLLAFGFYFSLLSAFHFGWRDLNVGNWIARIQAQEYALRATGWARTVSGVQSLLSVYLIALWALTYFTRPFE